MSRTAVPLVAALALSVMPWSAPAALGQDLVVTVENLSGDGGLFLTPVWFGFHDGAFDTYDMGAAVSAGVESLAEDGDFSTLSSEFQTAQSSGQEGVVLNSAGFSGAPVLDTGETGSTTISVSASNRYFSYASMIIPSNDAFIANGNPMAHEVYDAAGNFIPVSFLVLGSEVLDAGTEENTEMDAAFINQAANGDGVATADGASLHPGFIGSSGNPGGTPIILGGVNAAGATVDQVAADFTLAGFQVARISVTQVPEPATLALAGLALITLAARCRHL